MTVALTGQAGGKVAGLASYCIRVPTDDTPRVQEACLHLGHTICEIVEREMFPQWRERLLRRAAFLDRDGTLNMKAPDGGVRRPRPPTCGCCQG